ncbi:hypothetical protein LZ30DRAFT_729126 [Colletotrichum cereale]|nr:hypothetical protein LZ30DRAFT_729126 [Colletotrichum cereale]
MKLFSLLTLLCATSVSAGYYQCHCSKGKQNENAHRATRSVCNQMKGAELIRVQQGYDCKLSYSHSYPNAFVRLCGEHRYAVAGYCTWEMD